MRRILPLALVFVSCASSAGVPIGSPSTTVVVEGSSTSTSTTSLVVPSASVCSAFGAPVEIGMVFDPGLIEISGMALGGSGVLWVHNDSGSPPRLWALALSGEVLGSVYLDTSNIDWEDMDAGPTAAAQLYVADIGDNLGRRASVTIHRFDEPTEFGVTVTDFETLIVRYPDGSVDAEAFMVDPVTGDSFIVTKALSGRSAVLRIPVGAWSSPATQAQQVATIDLGPLAIVTAAAISDDGSVIGVRTYRDVWLWERRADETVADAVRGQPCRAPSASEPQGEALDFDGASYLTISEGAGALLYRVER